MRSATTAALLGVLAIIGVAILVEMQALWGEPTSDFTRMRRNRMHVCCGLVAEWK